MHIKKWFQMLGSMYYCTGVLKYNLQVSFWRTHRYAVPSPRDFFRLVEACEIVGCTVSNFKELIYLKKIILRRLIVTCFTDSCCFFFLKALHHLDLSLPEKLIRKKLIRKEHSQICKPPPSPVLMLHNLSHHLSQ